MLGYTCNYLSTSHADYCWGQNYYTPAENYWGIIFRAIQVISGNNYLYHYLPKILGNYFSGHPGNFGFHYLFRIFVLPENFSKFKDYSGVIFFFLGGLGFLVGLGLLA